MYILCTSKDAIFSVFELEFILNIYELGRDGKDYFAVKMNRAGFILSALGTMIFRKNGLIVVVLVLAGMLVLEKPIRNILLKYVLIVIAGYLIYVGPFYKSLDVEPGSSVEMYSVPLQQMARAYKYNASRFSKDEIAELTELVSPEALKNYRIGCADAVKNGVNKELLKGNISKYARLWLSLAVRNPNTYLKAFWLNTVDFWYPLTVYDGYGDLYGLNPETSDYFDYRTAHPGEEKVFLEPVHALLEYFSTDKNITTHVIPSMLLNSGWYILGWLLLVLRDLRDKKRDMLHVHCIMFWSLFTVLAGPMALVRYVLIFYLAAPVLLAFSSEEVRS